jgi:FkbM family methyltransferase
MAPEERCRWASEAARAALPGSDIEILWSGMPVWRIGRDYVPDPELLERDSIEWEKWAARPRKFLRDAEDYWFHVYRPRRGDVIVDIGAGRGEDVFAFSRAVGESGVVWALEPHPVSFAALEKLCELNGLANVRRFRLASVDAPRRLQIETLEVWESNYVRDGDPAPSSHAVDGVRFDDFCAEHGIDAIAYLKMNIEGAERLALPGCRAALRRSSCCTIAAHDFRADRGEGEAFRTLELVRAAVSEAGFEVVTREDPRYYVPYHVHGVRRGTGVGLKIDACADTSVGAAG